MAQWHGRVLAPATVLFLACASDPVLPVEGPFRVGSSTAWAGGTVDIISRTFAGWDDAGVLRLGATDIPLVRVDDSTMRAALPDTLNGSFAPAVVRGNALYPIPALTVHGYQDDTGIPWRFNLAGIVWPTGPHPGVIGFGLATGSVKATFIMLDLQSGSWQTNDYLVPVDPSSLGPRGPGPTTTEGVFAFYTKGGKLENWNLAGTPSHVRTHEAFPAYVTSFTTSADLGRDRWLRLTKHMLDLYRVNPLGGGTVALTSEAWYLQMSPARNRVLYVGSGTDRPTSVIDVTTGNVAYDIAFEGMKRVRAAAFTTDGALLAVVGIASTAVPATGGIRLLDAATGDVRWSWAAEFPLQAVSFDPVRPLVYAVGMEGERPTVLVFELGSGARLARMATPASAGSCSAVYEAAAAAVSASRQLHFLCEASTGQSRIYHFTLP